MRVSSYDDVIHDFSVRCYLPIGYYFDVFFLSFISYAIQKAVVLQIVNNSVYIKQTPLLSLRIQVLSVVCVYFFAL